MCQALDGGWDDEDIYDKSKRTLRGDGKGVCLWGACGVRADQNLPGGAAAGDPWIRRGLYGGLRLGMEPDGQEAEGGAAGSVLWGQGQPLYFLQDAYPELRLLFGQPQLFEGGGSGELFHRGRQGISAPLYQGGPGEGTRDTVPGLPLEPSGFHEEQRGDEPRRDPFGGIL